MAEVEKSNCTICRQLIPQSKNNFHHSSQQHVWFSNWKKKCSESLCQVLLGSLTKSYRQYFKAGEYCSSCLQTIRDISLTRSQLKCLEKRLNNMSQTILQNLKTNYDAIEEKTHPEIVEDSKTFFESYSDDQRIEIIYTVASKHAELATLVFPKVCIKDECFTESENEDVILPLVTIKVEDEEEVEYMDDSDEGLIGNLEGSPEFISPDSSNELMGQSTSRERQSIRLRKRKNEVKYDVNSSADEESDSEYIIPNDSNQIDCQSDDSVNIKPSPIINKRPISSSKSKSKSPLRKKKKRSKYVKKGRSVRVKVSPDVTCPTCNKTIKRTGLISHMRIHTGEKPFTCAECGNNFTSAGRLWKHSQRLHGKLNPNGRKIKRPEMTTKVISEMASRKRRYYCDLCSWSFNFKYRYLRHLKEKHLNKDVKDGDSFFFYYCDVDNCLCSFTSPTSLSSHYLDDHSTSLVNYAALECNVCKRMFVQENNLQTHMKSHEENNFGCDFCHMTFSSQKEMKIHKHRHEIQFKMSDYCHVCEECGEGFTTLDMLKKHNLMHEEPRKLRRSRTKEHAKFFCKICQKAIYNSSMEGHNMHTHTNEIKPNPKIVEQLEKKDHNILNNTDLKVKCNICCKRVISLERHMQFHAKCLYCNKIFKTHDLLESHKNEVHPPLPPKLSNDEQKCEVCDLDFKLNEHYRQHIIQQHPDEYKTTHPYICTFCWWVFQNEEDKNSHEKKVHEQKIDSSVNCSVCQKTMSKQKLPGHMKIHSDGFQCPHCTSKYKSFKILQYHLKRVHPQDRLDVPPKFVTKSSETKCEICDKDFLVNFRYRKHLVEYHPEDYEETHPHICRLCWRVFRTEQDKQFHVEASHDYKCSVENCGKIFSSRTRLLSHLNVHYKQKPFECPYCGKGFANDGNCWSHVHMVHTKHRTFRCKLCPDNEGYYVRKEFSKHVQNTHPEIPPHEYPSVLDYRKVSEPVKIIRSNISECYLECPPIKRYSKKPFKP